VDYHVAIFFLEPFAMSLHPGDSAFELESSSALIHQAPAVQPEMLLGQIQPADACDAVDVDVPD
jgi:hypothetical protein